MAESVQILSVSHRHQAIADYLLANPEMRKQDCAKAIGVSKEWLSIVINSDVFKEYWQTRRAAHEAHMREQICGAQLKLLLATYERLNDEVTNAEAKPDFVLAVAKHGNDFMGYSPKGSTRVTEEKIMEYSHPIDSSALADARAKMTRRVTQTIEHEG